MKYRNKVTGVVIESSNKISGGNWEEFVPEKKTKSVEQVEKTQEETQPEPKVNEEQPKNDTSGQAKAIGDITVDEIKQELKAFGVEFPANAKKQELYDLLTSQGK